MPTAMNVTLKAETRGFSASATRTGAFETLDQFEVTVDAHDGADDGTRTLDVAPSDPAVFVLMTASAYPTADDGGAHVTYKVDAKTTIFPLDGPLLVSGGAVGKMLGAMEKLVFTNASDADVTVQIVIGRSAS